MSVLSSAVRALLGQGRRAPWAASSSRGRWSQSPWAPASALFRLVTTVLSQGVDALPARAGGLGPEIVGGRVEVRALCRRLVRDVPGCVKLRGCGLPVPVAGVNSSIWHGSAFVEGKSTVSAGFGRVLCEGGRLVGGQLMACLSPLRCAWCSPMQWDLVERSLGLFVGAHVGRGGWLAHSTHTVPHRLSDDLEWSAGLLFESWSRLGRSRPLRRLRAELGFVAAVPVLHCTFSPRYGFHPHLHVMWFFRGDQAGFSEFARVLAEGWSDRVGGLSGRVVSDHGSGAVLVRDPNGLVRYLRPDDWENPANNCADPDHGGCWSCDPDGSRLLGDDPMSGSPMADLTGDLVPAGVGARPGLEVFSGLGPAAVRGNKLFQAKLAEWLSSMHGRRRVVSGLPRLRAEFGALDDVSAPRLIAPGGDRLWVSAALFRQVELHPRWVGSLVRDGLSLSRTGSPFDVADLWGSELGRRVSAGFTEEGEPILRLADEVSFEQGVLEPVMEGVES